MSTLTGLPRQKAAPPIDRAVVVAAVTLVAAAAWVLMAMGHDHQVAPDVAVMSAPELTPVAAPPGDAAGHHAHGAAAAHEATVHEAAAAHGTATPSLATAISRLSGWTLMVLAMMLPPALPLVHTLRAVTRRRDGSWLLTALGTLAFTVPWIAAGVLLVSIDIAVTAGTGLVEWTQQHLQLVAGLVAIAAGAYQVTSAKRACLTACRSPRQLALLHWHGLAPGKEAAQIGLRYGVVCVGCCWALMLLTLVIGWPAMPVMVAMTAVMAAERLVPRVRPLIPSVAVAAIALGIALLAGIVPASHLIAGGHL